MEFQRLEGSPLGLPALNTCQPDHALFASPLGVAYDRDVIANHLISHPSDVSDVVGFLRDRTAIRYAISEELFRIGELRLQSLRKEGPAPEVSQRAHSAYRLFEELLANNSPDSLDQGLNTILDVLTQDARPHNSDTLPGGTMEVIFVATAFLLPELSCTPSMDSGILPKLSVRKLLALVGEACVTDDLAGDNYTHFAASFLLDGCPSAFERLNGRGINSATALAIYSSIVRSHPDEPYRGLIGLLEGLRERSHWMVAAEWLSTNLREYGCDAEAFYEHMCDLIAQETIDSVAQLQMHDELLVPLGWTATETAHVILGRIALEREGYKVSIINSGISGDRKRDGAAPRPFSPHLLMDTDYSIEGLTLEQVSSYLQPLMHLSRHLKKAESQPAEDVIDYALQKHYGFWEAGNGRRIPAQGRIKIQRGPTCGTEVYKQVTKLVVPGHPQRIKDKLYVLTFLWQKLVSAGFGELAISKIKATLAKEWLLFKSNTVSARAFAQLAQEVMNTQALTLGKVVNRVVERLLEASDFGCLSRFMDWILLTRPEMAIDCVAMVHENAGVQEAADFAREVLAKMQMTNLYVQKRTTAWLKVQPELAAWINTLERTGREG